MAPDSSDNGTANYIGKIVIHGGRTAVTFTKGDLINLGYDVEGMEDNAQLSIKSDQNCVIGAINIPCREKEIESAQISKPWYRQGDKW